MQTKEIALLALGDCHTDILKKINQSNDIFKNKIVVLQKKGASAYGLNNYDSSTRSLQFFIESISKFPIDIPILLNFGEVDCNVLIPHKLHKYNSCIAEEVSECIFNYEKFIQHLMKLKRNIAIIQTIDPPTQYDPINPNNEKRKMLIEWKHRKTIVNNFNSELRILANKYSLATLDIHDDIIDSNTGSARDEFLHSSCRAHELNRSAIKKIISQKLRSIFTNNGEII